MEDETITIAEAAALYGCTHNNMSYLVRTGRIPHTRFGKLLCVKRADVLALKAQRDDREQNNCWIEPVQEVA